MVECEYRYFLTQVVNKKVLIDTWWNVNNNAYFIMTVQNSFNRYMVECESSQLTSLNTTLDRFNRYMVECELY